MSKAYTKALPRDEGLAVMQEYPAPVKAVTSVYFRDNLPVSSAITLDPNTSALEVSTSGGQGVVIRWVPVGETNAVAPYGSVISSGLGANFDHCIPPNSYRRFVVPRETAGQPIGAMGSVNGLYQRVAVSNAGTVSSVIVIQY